MSDYPKWYIKHGAKVIDIYPGNNRLDISTNVALREKYAVAMGLSRHDISLNTKKEA